MDLCLKPCGLSKKKFTPYDTKIKEVHYPVVFNSLPVRFGAGEKGYREIRHPEKNGLKTVIAERL